MGYDTLAVSGAKKGAEKKDAYAVYALGIQQPEQKRAVTPHN